MHDFECLSQTGNPRGFPHRNSASHYLDWMYNYTDSPSVLSGSTLLILGPRLRGSTELDPSYAGQRTYDFVQQSSRVEIKNQLSAFGAVLHDPNAKFVGTIIRLPLRTEEQATRSMDVSDDEFTTEADVLSAFSEFRVGLVESLLFLQNLVSTTLRIASEDGVYAEAQMVENQDSGVARGSVAISLREIFTDRTRLDFDTTFLVAIHFRGHGQDETTSEWVVFHHARRGLGADDELVNWGETRGLVPWVALAARIRGAGVGLEEETEFSGRLFNRLPLPIDTHQPVHVHGMFFITSDCLGIRQVRGQAAQGNTDTDQGELWNSTLLNECLTFAWSQFLLAMTLTRPTIEHGFRYWPRDMARDPTSVNWASFIETFLELVVHTELPIWPTCRGWLGANKVFLAHRGDRRINTRAKDPDFDIQDTMDALEEVGMAITYPPDEIYSDARKCLERTEERLLTPVTVAGFLQTAPEKLVHVNRDIRQRLLEYLLSESSHTGYTHLNNIELFPLCDGSFSASGTLSQPVLMLPMDDHERDLFDLWPHMTVDVRRIGTKTLRRLRTDMEKVEKQTSLKQWQLEYVYDYYMATYFSEINLYATGDVVEAGDLCFERRFSENIASLWDWIISRVQKGVPNNYLLTRLGDLWLIPVMGRGYRRVCPTSKELLLNPSSHEELGSFLKSVCKTKEDEYQINRLYCADLVSTSTTKFFSDHKIIQACDNFENLMTWLENRPQFVSFFCSQERKELVRFLDMLSIDFLKSANSWETLQLLEKLKRLSVFEEIRNNSKCTSLNWTTLERPRVRKYVAVTMESVVPDIDGIVFLSARNPPMLRLLKQFCLAEVPNIPQLLEEYVFPGISAETTLGILERLVAFALDNFDSFPAGGVAKMADMEFVPVRSQTSTGVLTRSFKSPRQCVDPGSGLGNLFFKHESVWIEDEFWKTNSEKLAGMQLIDKITVDLVLNRVNTYSRALNGITTDELARKVEMLMIVSNKLEIPTARSLKGRPWLPARKYPSGDIVLTNAEDCRDESFTDLVGYAMPIVPFGIGKTWCKALEWDGLIPATVIESQVQILVDKREFSRLGVILCYLEKNRQVEGYLDGLREMKWILGVSGQVFKCDDIFFSHAVQLNPSCDCIGDELNRYKSVLVNLGVQEQPGLPRLRRLIDDLDQGGTLSQSDVDLAINAILLATKLYPKEDFAKFMAPDYTNTLRELSALTAGKPEYCESEVFFLHPGIPQQCINVLGVPTLDQRQFEVIETPFGRDSHSTKARMTIITSAIDHFPVECTFNAYLGNAEDSGTATMIGWILDRKGDWEKTSILTEELSETMGPALLCWNDGRFQEDYFCELMNIGKRTKSNDTEGISSYGTEYFQPNLSPSRIMG